MLIALFNWHFSQNNKNPNFGCFIASSLNCKIENKQVKKVAG